MFAILLPVGIYIFVFFHVLGWDDDIQWRDGFIIYEAEFASKESEVKK